MRGHQAERAYIREELPAWMVLPSMLGVQSRAVWTTARKATTDSFMCQCNTILNGLA